MTRHGSLALALALALALLPGCARSHLRSGPGDYDAGTEGGGAGNGAGSGGTDGGTSGTGAGVGGTAGSVDAGSGGRGESLESWRGELRSLFPYTCDPGRPTWGVLSPDGYTEPVSLVLKRDGEGRITDGLIRIGDPLPASTPPPPPDAQPYWLCVQSLPSRGVPYPVRSPRETTSRLTFQVFADPTITDVPASQLCWSCSPVNTIDLMVSRRSMEGTIDVGGGFSSIVEIRLTRVD